MRGTSTLERLKLYLNFFTQRRRDRRGLYVVRKPDFSFMNIFIMKIRESMLETLNLVMMRYSTFGSSPRPPRALPAVLWRDDIFGKTIANI